MKSPAKRYFGMGLGAIFTLAIWGVGCGAPAMPSDESSAAEAQEQTFNESSALSDFEPMAAAEPTEPRYGAQPSELMMPVSLERGEANSEAAGQPLTAGCGDLDEMADPAMGMAIPPPDEEPAGAVATPDSAAPSWCNGQACSWCEKPALFSSCSYQFKQAKYSGVHWWDSGANQCYCKASYAGCC